MHDREQGGLCGTLRLAIPIFAAVTVGFIGGSFLQPPMTAAGGAGDHLRQVVSARPTECPTVLLECPPPPKAAVLECPPPPKPVECPTPPTPPPAPPLSSSPKSGLNSCLPEPRVCKHDAVSPAAVQNKLIPVHVPSWLLSGDYGECTFRTTGGPTTLSPGLAQLGEDGDIYNKFFFGATGGTILESGALDGKLLSISHLFETQAAWRAVLIEAAPSNYNKIAAHRPNALSINIAMCSKPANVHFLDGARLPHPVFGSHLALGGSEEEEEEGVAASLRQAGILNDAGAIVDVAALEKLDFVDVLTCQRPSDILRHLGITHIHVWVLDVEGGELEVLEAFNFNPASGGVSVDVIMLEVNDAGSPKFPKIVEVLAAAGLRHRDGAGHPNHYFLRDGFVPISK